MDRFGWVGHPGPLKAAWDASVGPDDAVLVVGDISWATRPNEAQGDLAWLDARPGKKVLVKGNHDFWWGDSAAKLRKTLEPFKTVVGFLQNSAVAVGPWLIAGSRLWTSPEAPPMPGGEMGDEVQKPDYIARECNRLALSIAEARKLEAAATAPVRRVAAVHFPPLYSNGLATAFSAVIEGWAPRLCVYGHLHGPGIAAGFVGEHGGVPYRLVSCDAAGFAPVLVDEA
jgi:predicted phosphohydrolase